jgi:hypothetical protein
MKHLFLILIGLGFTTNVHAGICRPDPSCASGESCLVDMGTGEYQCKKDPDEGYLTVKLCHGREHFPLTVYLQEALTAGEFDRVVVSRETQENYFIALGYPHMNRKIIAASPRGTLQLVPLFGDQEFALTIGDRNLGKAFTYTVTCYQPSQHH